ncbi:MAG: hypothetical protein GY832_17330 [Chloroflexi bacterium]|nr:hypothetical protein [Chloroflexota bacterium]
MSGLSTRQTIPVIGVVIGLALGIWYTWSVNPVELVNTYPALLRTDYRRDWVHLTVLSYVDDGDLERVHARLNGIEQNDVAPVVQALIEKYAAAGRSAETMRSLTKLAQTLDVYTSAMLVYLGTPAPVSPAPTRTASPTLFPTSISEATYTPTPSRTPTLPPTPTSPPRTPSPSLSPTISTPEPTSTPSPPTPTPLLSARLQLVEQEQICQAGQREQITVMVKDERGREVAGVEVWLMWPGGADRAVTGLKPRNGEGYADFDVEWGVNYSLSTSELGRPLVDGLRLESCPTDEGGELVIGSWRIVLEPDSSQDQ